MAIFKNEIKQIKNITMICTIILAVLITLMLPVYIQMVTGAGSGPVENLNTNLFNESLGTSIEILSTPLGMYSFLTFFILFATSIYGMNLGLGIMTKEYKQSSADFLMTKPFSRTSIYYSKLVAGALSIIIIGSFYLIASFGAMKLATDDEIRILTLILIALPTILVPLLFLFLGMLFGTIFPKIRTTIIISTGIVFLTYANGSMSRFVGIGILEYLSPLHYFNGATVIMNNSYETKFILMFLLLCVLFILIGHHIFQNKDIEVLS